MKTLYYVSAYNRERNERARCVLTADTQAQAERLVLEWLPGFWTVPKVVAICAVPNTVELMEL